MSQGEKCNRERRRHASKSSMIEGRRRHQIRSKEGERERREGSQRCVAKRKKKRLCWLAPFGQRFTPHIPFCSSSSPLLPPLFIFIPFFLCFFLASANSRSTFSFPKFALFRFPPYDKFPRDIFLSPSVTIAKIQRDC